MKLYAKQLNRLLYVWKTHMLRSTPWIKYNCLPVSPIHLVKANPPLWLRHNHTTRKYLSLSLFQINRREKCTARHWMFYSFKLFPLFAVALHVLFLLEAFLPHFFQFQHIFFSFISIFHSGLHVAPWFSFLRFHCSLARRPLVVYFSLIKQLEIYFLIVLLIFSSLNSHSEGIRLKNTDIGVVAHMQQISFELNDEERITSNFYRRRIHLVHNFEFAGKSSCLCQFRRRSTMPHNFRFVSFFFFLLLSFTRCVNSFTNRLHICIKLAIDQFTVRLYDERAIMLNAPRSSIQFQKVECKFV